MITQQICRLLSESGRAFGVGAKASGLIVLYVSEFKVYLIRLHNRQGMKIARAKGKLRDK